MHRITRHASLQQAQDGPEAARSADVRICANWRTTVTEHVQKCQKLLQPIAAKTRLFDHLVGAREKRLRDRETKRLSCFEINDQLKFGRQLNWQIGRFGTLEDQIDI
jgi:hypothetical protein